MAGPKPVMVWQVEHKLTDEHGHVWRWLAGSASGIWSPVQSVEYDSPVAAKDAGRQWLNRYCSHCELEFRAD